MYDFIAFHFGGSKVINFNKQIVLYTSKKITTLY